MPLLPLVNTPLLIALAALLNANAVVRLISLVLIGLCSIYLLR